MSILAEEMFDTRKLERYVAEGLLTQQQVDEYLAGLEDCAANADTSSIQMVGHARGRRYGGVEETQVEEDEG